MKKFLLVSVSAALMATPLLAGSPAPMVVYEPDVVAMGPQATDWSGPYIGGMVSFGSGKTTRAFRGEVISEALHDATQFGGFAGYNFQRGSIVFGPEAAYSTGALEGRDPDYAYHWFADLKGRVGYAFGDALVYGVAGWSLAEYDYDTDLESQSGFNYGVGVDYHVTERLFVGLEYLHRDLNIDTGPVTSRGGNIQSIQLRAGLTF